jgi:hypothetical protein
MRNQPAVFNNGAKANVSAAAAIRDRIYNDRAKAGLK